MYTELMLTLIYTFIFGSQYLGVALGMIALYIFFFVKTKTGPIMRAISQSHLHN
jgi:hypothetical protein